MPHYFALGESPWFRGLYRDAREVRIQLGDLPSDQISFTYPDSITSMGLLPHYGIEVERRPYHYRVFRVEDLPDVVAEYGLPVGAAPSSYDGHQRDTGFDHYIEVQMWAELEPADGV